MISFKEYFIYEMINEGGASGHMSHLFEDMSLTFRELKNIIKDIFSGKVDISEKTDGVALAITYKDGEVRAARNKSTLQNPMSIEGVSNKFEGRGEIKNAFVNSMRDIQNAIMTLSEKDRQDIFNNGFNYMAFEVIYPPTKNVVNYGNRCLIQLHGVNIYDNKWKKIGEDKTLAVKLLKLLEKENALNQKTFEIIGPAFLKLNKDFSKDIKTFINELDKIIKPLKDSNNIGDYMKYKWDQYIDEEMDMLDININDEIKKSLIDRFAFGFKAYTKINIIKNVNNDQFTKWFNDIDKMYSNINSNFIKPLEVFIIKIGTQLLINLSGFVSANPDITIKDMNDELNNAIKEIQSSNIKMAIDKLNMQLSKIDSIGDNHIAPLEGVVFLYKGKPYKITGTYGARNAIQGLFKFSR